MCIFFIDKKFILLNLSGFKPGNLCVNQLLSITHKMCEHLDNEIEVRSVFLDISKAFDKVWDEGVIFKLQQNDIL